MIEQDHLIVRSACLDMVYCSLHLFPNEYKVKLMELFLEEFFYDLIFSWSFNVWRLTILLILYQFHFIHNELVSFVKRKKARSSEEISPGHDSCVNLAKLASIN